MCITFFQGLDGSTNSIVWEMKWKKIELAFLANIESYRSYNIDRELP